MQSVPNGHGRRLGLLSGVRGAVRVTSTPTSYPAWNPPNDLPDWQVFEVLWHAYRRDDTAAGEAGVLPETVADELGVRRSTAASHLRHLEAEGTVVQLHGWDPETTRPRTTWAPAPLADGPTEPTLPGWPTG